MDIAKVQKILATKAFHQPQHRFNDLYRYLKDTNWLEAARFAILRNAGAKTPGLDRVVGKDLADEEWVILCGSVGYSRYPMLDTSISGSRVETHSARPNQILIADTSSAGF